MSEPPISALPPSPLFPSFIIQTQTLSSQTDKRELNTGGNLTYIFTPVYGDAFSFSVACSNNAQLALTSAPKETTPMYEIILCDGENKISVIRLNKGELRT